MQLVTINGHRRFIVNVTDEFEAIKIACNMYNPKDKKDKILIECVTVEWIDDSDVFLGRN